VLFIEERREHPKFNKGGMTKETIPRYETRTEMEGEENEGACIDGSFAERQLKKTPHAKSHRPILPF